MRQVADFVVLRNQVVALRHAALRLIHGKALFEYLRKHNVRGKARARILAHFHRTLLYEHAVVAVLWRFSARGKGDDDARRQRGEHRPSARIPPE